MNLLLARNFCYHEKLFFLCNLFWTLKHCYWIYLNNYLPRKLVNCIRAFAIQCASQLLGVLKLRQIEIFSSHRQNFWNSFAKQMYQLGDESRQYKNFSSLHYPEETGTQLQLDVSWWTKIHFRPCHHLTSWSIMDFVRSKSVHSGPRCNTVCSVILKCHFKKTNSLKIITKWNCFGNCECACKCKLK